MSLIQPGLIATPEMLQSGTAYKIFSMAAQTVPVEEDKQIISQMLSNPDVTGENQPQSTGDVAFIIEDIIVSAKPDFRCQTSETVKEMARKRFIDPTGNDTIEMWLKQ